MTVQDIHYQALEAPRTAESLLRRVAAAFTSWRAREEQRRTLAQLSDHLMRDLGLSDADIWRETHSSPRHT
jgi:uncharacterized protein YjiS (DUF1127 family)